jgi:hypothetical protein
MALWYSLNYLQIIYGSKNGTNNTIHHAFGSVQGNRFSAYMAPVICGMMALPQVHYYSSLQNLDLPLQSDML